jgi:hypothetical protein
MQALLNRNARMLCAAALPNAKKEHYHALRVIC